MDEWMGGDPWRDDRGMEGWRDKWMDEVGDGGMEV